jgi:hypothetical protein
VRGSEGLAVERRGHVQRAHVIMKESWRRRELCIREKTRSIKRQQTRETALLPLSHPPSPRPTINMNIFGQVWR